MRQPLFANPLNLPWSVKSHVWNHASGETTVVRVKDCNGDMVPMLNTSAGDASNYELLVEIMNKGARNPLLQQLCVGDVLIQKSQKDANLARQKVLGLKNQYGVSYIETECVDGTTVMQGVESTMMALSMGMLTVEVAQ